MAGQEQEGEDRENDDHGGQKIDMNKGKGRAVITLAAEGEEGIADG